MVSKVHGIKKQKKKKKKKKNNINDRDYTLG